MMLSSPTSSEASEGSGTGASCSPGRLPANTKMHFSCRSIRVGSYKVIIKCSVTASSQGFEFSIPPPQEGPDVLVHLPNSKIVKVLGQLSGFFPVLFVSTSQECSVEVCTKLGWNRQQPEYFDPRGPEESQKWITFLPEAPFSQDQKVFLRHVFPGPLLQEIKQTEANKILVKSSPSPSRPRPHRRGVTARSLPTLSKASRGPGTEASCSLGTPLANTMIHFSCRRIRVGSYTVASDNHWVTASSQGFEFSIPPAEEGPDMRVDLPNSDIVKVQGYLSCYMPVLFVSTSQECSVEVCTKLGLNRQQPEYFDPSGPEETQKRITFLPEPPFSVEQKAFLRRVFPGPLLEEISQTQANEILIMSSPSPLVAATLPRKQKGDGDPLSTPGPQTLSSPLAGMADLGGAPQPDGSSPHNKKECIRLKVQKTASQSPGSDCRGAMMLSSPTSSEASEGSGTGASCSPGRLPANTKMHFSCRSIRVGSYKAIIKCSVTASSQGFEFSIPPPQEGPDVLVHLPNSKIVKVLGQLSGFFPVLFVSTSQECSVEVCTKLGWNRQQPEYFDPRGPEESQKWITFLPEAPFSQDQKVFLRDVFPGPLLQEIKQTEANKILVKSSPSPSRLRPHRRGVTACSLPTLSKASRGPGTEASCSPGTPLANTMIHFSCRRIRVGSYTVASDNHWVTASSQGFRFSIPPAQEGPDVRVDLPSSDIVKVQGYLSCSMPVLFVSTSQECSVEVCTKLGLNRQQPEYFDPSGPEETQKRITFLPGPPFSAEQKAFLRRVFPGPLLEEISETQANEILIMSSPSPLVAATLPRKRKGDGDPLSTPGPQTLSSPLAGMADLGGAPQPDGSSPHNKKECIRLGAMMLSSPTSSEASEGSGTGASCSPGRLPANTTMHFSCRSIRVGSYKAIIKCSVTASSQGFEFSIPPPQEGPDVLVHLPNSKIVKVLGQLSGFFPVLFVSTSQECSVEVCTKLGWNRQQPEYFDPRGPEESQKWITFLPEEPFSQDQKVFLRDVFPGPLLQEIKQTEANKILVKSSPSPSRPRPHRRGVTACSLPTLSKASRGPGTEASCSPGTPLDNTMIHFSCRRIRVGSYTVASDNHWVTASSQGFEFSIPPAQEGPDVRVDLPSSDIVKVQGYLSCSMPVLFVSTSQECSVEVCTKLGLNRQQPEYFDPSGPEETQKRITFLPGPPFSAEQKAFLRRVFPGPLLEEISETQANEILIMSSPSPLVAATLPRKRKGDGDPLSTPGPQTLSSPLAGMADLGGAPQPDGSSPHNKKECIRLSVDF
ncbi:uncharacterized protein LOC144099460 isoform X2 [Amblyomma americanum]